MTMMRKLVSVVMAITAMMPVCAAEKNAKPFTAPEIREWKGASGELRLPESPAIVYSDASLEKIADIFAEQYKALTGNAPKVKTGKAADGDILLSLTLTSFLIMVIQV